MKTTFQYLSGAAALLLLASCASTETDRDFFIKADANKDGRLSLAEVNKEGLPRLFSRFVPPDNSPVHERNHYCMMHPDGRIEYGFPNREMRFTPTRSWQVPGVEDQWNAEGLMETPFGNFFLKSLVDDSVFVSKTGMTFWEGPMSMHEGDSNGKQIGMAYVEQYFQPKGGPARMRTLPEQDLARELPFSGPAPGAANKLKK